MVEATPGLLLKVIWVAHFALAAWAMMSAYLPLPYCFTHLGVLAFGFWAIVSKESVDAVLMFMVTLCFSVLNDILLISIYAPRANDNIERRGVADGYKNEYRWALGMSIVNLLLKPVSILLVFCIYRSRSSGTEFVLGIPGVSSTGQSSSHNQTGQGPYNNIESAQDSHPGIYGRPPYPYQSAPPPPTYDSKQGPSNHQQPPQA